MKDGESVKPFRLQMRVKNNRLIEAREEMGFTTVASMSRASGIPQSVIGKYENFKSRPIRVSPQLVDGCISEGCTNRKASNRIVCRLHHPNKELLVQEQWQELPKTWERDAMALASFLSVEPEWLWPECSRDISNARALSVSMDMAQVAQFASMPDVVEKSQLRERVDEAIRTLTSREGEVLTMRYGLDGGEEMTLRKVASEVGITKERIRQIELMALLKIRHSSSLKKLKDFND